MTSRKVLTQARQLLLISKIYRSTQKYLPLTASSEILLVKSENNHSTAPLATNRADLSTPIFGENIRPQPIKATDRSRIQASQDRVKAIVTAAWEPVIIIDRHFQIVTTNRAFDLMFELTPNQLAGQSQGKFGETLWAIQGLKQCLEDIFQHNTYFKNYAVEHTFDRLGRKSMLISASQIPNLPTEPLIILKVIDTIRHHRGNYEL